MQFKDDTIGDADLTMLNKAFDKVNQIIYFLTLEKFIHTNLGVRQTYHRDLILGRQTNSTKILIV